MNGTRGWGRTRTEYKVGIVGHEKAKFDPQAEAEARQVIENIIRKAQRRYTAKVRGKVVVVSGGCHLGGVDIWAEEVAKELDNEMIVFYPKKKRWEPDGYKERNIKIAETSDEVHCIVVKKLPICYKGPRFDLCYHCGTTNHIKSGGCWTAKYAEKIGKKATWHEI